MKRLLEVVLGLAVVSFAVPALAQMDFSPEEAQRALAQPAQPPAEGSGVIGELAAGGPQAQAGPAAEDAGPQRLREDIWAVQRIWALRAGRFELMPAIGTSLNDPFVTHTALAVAANYYVTNVLAVGVNFYWFQFPRPFGNIDTETNFQVARSFRLVIPVNQYQLSANVTMSYVPLYGKFALFNEWILHWDAFLTGGVGVIRTRPVAVVDPEHRVFRDFQTLIDFNFGIGLRAFISKFLGVFMELHTYTFLEKTENLDINRVDPSDEQFWFDSRPHLTWNVMIQAGVMIFLPFNFEYRLPK